MKSSSETNKEDLKKEEEDTLNRAAMSPTQIQAKLSLLDQDEADLNAQLTALGEAAKAIPDISPLNNEWRDIHDQIADPTTSLISRLILYIRLADVESKRKPLNDRMQQFYKDLTALQNQIEFIQKERERIKALIIENNKTKLIDDLRIQVFTDDINEKKAYQFCTDKYQKHYNDGHMPQLESPPEIPILQKRKKLGNPSKRAKLQEKRATCQNGICPTTLPCIPA